MGYRVGMVDRLSMGGVGGTSEPQLFLATAVATRRECYVALAIAAAFFLAFAAIAPLARVPLARVPAFVSSYEAALFCIDLITAALLFDQFIRFRSVGLLALACGYLFDAFIVVPHALTFPGAFAPEGLLGAGPQSAAWLYVFWHGVFPLFVMAYAVLRRNGRGGNAQPVGRTRRSIAGAVAGVAALAAALALIATVAHDWLPVLIRDGDYAPAASKGVTPAVWLLTLLALASLWWRRQPRVIDLWLMLVMWIWLFDIALSAVAGAGRFDLGWYAGRIFGLGATSLLLVSLLIEMARMHAGALGAAALAEGRLNDLARMRGRAGDPPPKKGTEDFIQRRNIANYRALLGSGELDGARRHAIEALLAEEEAKLGAGQHRG